MLKGLRYQKRITLIPRLLALNLSKTGISLTIGPPGFCINLGRGGATGSVGAPGTGLSYRRRLGRRRERD